MLLPNYVVIAVHQKVHELSVLLIHAMGEVTRHEVTVEGLSVTAVCLLPLLFLLIHTPASIVRRAVSWFLDRLFFAITVSVTPGSSRLSRRPSFTSLLR